MDPRTKDNLTDLSEAIDDIEQDERLDDFQVIDDGGDIVNLDKNPEITK